GDGAAQHRAGDPHQAVARSGIRRRCGVIHSDRLSVTSDQKILITGHWSLGQCLALRPRFAGARAAEAEAEAAAAPSTICTMASPRPAGFFGIASNALSSRNEPILPSMPTASENFAWSFGLIVVVGADRRLAPSK